MNDPFAAGNGPANHIATSARHCGAHTTRSLSSVIEAPRWRPVPQPGTAAAALRCPGRHRPGRPPGRAGSAPMPPIAADQAPARRGGSSLGRPARRSRHPAEAAARGPAPAAHAPPPSARPRAHLHAVPPGTGGGPAPPARAGEARRGGAAPPGHPRRRPAWTARVTGRAAPPRPHPAPAPPTRRAAAPRPRAGPAGAPGRRRATGAARPARPAPGAA